MASQPSTHPVMDIGKAIEWCEKKTGRELAVSQKEAIKVASQSRVLIITGGPGVGKTTLLNSLLLIFRAKKIKCLLCAPTGRAAKRLGEATGLEAKTIHRLLEFQPASGGFTRNEERPLGCDLLVVGHQTSYCCPPSPVQVDGQMQSATRGPMRRGRRRSSISSSTG